MVASITVLSVYRHLTCVAMHMIYVLTAGDCMQVNGKPLYVAIAQKKVDRQRRLKTYFQQPQASFQNPQGPGGYMPGPFYGPGKICPRQLCFRVHATTWLVVGCNNEQ